MADEDDDTPTPATFRVAPVVSLFAVAFFALCLSPIAFQGGAWFLLFGVPVLAAVWIVRVRTVVDTAGVHVRGEVGTRSLPWSQLATLRLPAKGWVRAVARADARELTLRGVRVRDLGRIGVASGGRISAPTPAEAAAAEERARELEAVRMRAAALREQEERLRELEAQHEADAADAAAGDVVTHAEAGTDAAREGTRDGRGDGQGDGTEHGTRDDARDGAREGDAADAVGTRDGAAADGGGAAAHAVDTRGGSETQAETQAEAGTRGDAGRGA